MIECSPLLAWTLALMVAAAVVNACLRVYLGTRRWWSEFTALQDPVEPEIISTPRLNIYVCPHCHQAIDARAFPGNTPQPDEEC